MQLSKRDQTDRVAQEQWAQQRATELLASAVAPKEERITALEQMLAQVEVALAQKTEVCVWCKTGDSARVLVVVGCRMLPWWCSVEVSVFSLTWADDTWRSSHLHSLSHELFHTHTCPIQPHRTQELEESRRLYSSQRRALKDALSAAAEREAAEVAAGESGLEAATAAAEEEVERLAQVCLRVHSLVAVRFAWVECVAMNHQPVLGRA